MFCKKIILVNWGNIPNLEFEFGPVNLFSGGNGSGKTTAADAIQSLMTASYENLFNYNPGQEETTQRGRGGKQVRTLASYILGCDDGSYGRLQPTDGYIVGVFCPTRGETGSQFSAVMGVRAAMETVGRQRQARQRQLGFHIVPGEELGMDQFCKDDRVTDLDQIGHQLMHEYGKSNVEFYDKKGAYLNRLYGLMRGMKSSVPRREALHAAKTFSNFMAYKPVKSINEFVAKEILEPRDLTENIKQVSELMKTIHGMEAETRQITEVIDNLYKISASAQSYIHHWIGWKIENYREYVRQGAIRQREMVEAINQQRENQREQKETHARLGNLEDKGRALHSQLVKLEARRQGIPILKDKDDLENSIEQCKQQLVAQASPLLQQIQQLDQNHGAAKALVQQMNTSSDAVDLPVLEGKALAKDLKQVIDLGVEQNIDLPGLLTQDFAGIAKLEGHLDELIDYEKAHQALVSNLYEVQHPQGNGSVATIRDQLVALVNQRTQAQNRLQEQVAAKKREVQRLENRAVNYPPHVEAAMRAIQQQCPQARPAVLCDFINITEPAWQMAIEGYIGGSRFSILVEADFEAEAIRIVRNLPGRRNNSKVIQGAKAQRDAAKRQPVAGSILEVISFDHKIAEYYIKASYGDVKRVDDEHALRLVSRGITPEGLGAGSYSMFRCDIDEADLVFGQGARERALEAKLKQLEQLQISSHDAEKRARSTALLLDAVNKIKAVNVSSIIRSMLGLYRRKQNDEQNLAALDLTEFKNLEDELIALNKEWEETESSIKAQHTRIGNLEGVARSLTDRVDEIARQQEVIEQKQEEQEERMRCIAPLYSDFDTDTEIEQAEESALNHAKNASNNDTFAEQIAVHLQRCGSLDRELYEAVIRNNQLCKPSDNIVYLRDSGADGTEDHNIEWFKRAVVVLKEANSITNRLKNNVLVGKHEQLADLRDGFNSAFVTDLCHSIYQSINDGKRILLNLNKELESHRFGTDRERYFFDMAWVPEYKEYWRFFQEVIKLPSLGDGNSLFEAELDEKSEKVREKLLAMLLDNDELTATRELKRLCDYRNYREYEIYKEPEGKEKIPLSQYGTGSGGQLETPAYIIRSAAVTSAFKFNEGSSHCRMVLVDEAFSKMDESRSREVIHYLTNELGLQLIFIMPTSKSGPFMDLISHQTIFTKCPSIAPIGELNSQVLVDRKVCNQEMIKDLWEKHRRNVRAQTTLDFMEEFAELEAQTKQ